jgi:predicted ATPase/DNA-binding XRE family transcriptional regulator
MNQSEDAMNARTPAFGATLRRFREQAGVSQELLAERAGLSLRGISDLERGARTTPRLETVRMLADGLQLGEGGRAELLAARSATSGMVSPSARRMSNLPLPSTTFFGRNLEMVTIQNMLVNPDQRLVSLVGSCGIGKTRLAVEAGRGLADVFPDGVVFAGLASLKSPNLVLPTIAAALGAPDSGRSGLLDLLGVTLRDRIILLVLDNVEQVVEAAPDVAALLERCPTLSILATSRVILNIAAETVVPVAPLEITDVAAMASRTLDLPDAVALFVDRARAVHPEFRLTTPDILVVADLVMRLEGLPLAIELAAARTRIMSPDALLARMDRQLPLLTGGGRDVPERQQTMRDAIAWSYDLLSPKEQAIFRRLSIFRAGCTLEAAERVLGVAGDLSDIDILDGLAALVDSSLLQRRQPEGSPARFVMLAAVREFGLEQLAAQGEEEATREAAYRRWYLHLASRAEPHSATDGEAEWLELLEREHDNFRSALSWLIDRDRIEDALDLAGELWFFRWIRGHYAEAREQYEDLLRHPRGQGRTLARARSLTGLGVVSLHQGDSERSREALDEAISISRALGERPMLAMALLCSGTTWLRTGHLDEAEADTSECHAIAKEIRAIPLQESALSNLSTLAGLRGEEDTSRALLHQQFELACSIKETWGMAIGLANLGILSQRDGNLDLAEEQVEEAARLFIELKDKRDLPAAYRTLADIARMRGDLDKATSRLEQALDVSRDMGDRPMIAQCVAGIGKIALLRGAYDVAKRLARESIQGHREVGDDVSVTDGLYLLAEICAAEGDPANAARYLGVIDRALEERGAVRMKLSPEEHATFVTSLKTSLGEPGWRKHWSAGYREDVRYALNIGLDWVGDATLGEADEDFDTRRASGLDR